MSHARHQPPSRTLLLACVFLSLGAVGITGCMSPAKNSAVSDYTSFLEQHPGANLTGEREQQAIESIQNYLANLNPENITANTGKVYAPHAFFNDTLKTERGSNEIRDYFLATSKNVDEIRVYFQDTARSGNDYYLRWIMDVKFKKIQPGKVSRTIGMTHIRFNEQGQVILHQDYWDSATGFYQHIPVLGTGIRTIRSLF